MVKYLKGRNALVQCLKWNADTDSDCEDESTGVGGRALKEKGGEWEDRAVLVAGSFSACVRFLAPPSH